MWDPRVHDVLLASRARQIAYKFSFGQLSSSVGLVLEDTQLHFHHGHLSPLFVELRCSGVGRLGRIPT